MFWRSSVALSSRESGLFISILLIRVGVPVVERAHGRDAPELLRLVAQSGPAEQLFYGGIVGCAHRLLVRVRAEGFDLAAHVDHRLVKRVAQGVAGVAAHD